MKPYNIFVCFLLALSGNLYSQTYCNPSFSSGCTFNNYISSVSVGGMSNTASGCTVSNYTNKVASMNAGDTIPMTVTVAGWDGIAIYVDLNNDGDMTDTNETLYIKYNAFTPPITYNFNITIPASTAPGNHRFRVNCGNGGSVGGGNPCVSTSYGNFHDYTLNVNNNCPGDSNLTVSNVTSSSATISWAARNGQGYEYILNTNPATPQISGTATTSTSYSASGLTNGQQYYFHIRTSCGNGQYSAWGRLDFVACDLPNAQINQSGNVKICRGDTLELSVPFDTSYTYTWYRNNSKIPGQNTNSIKISVFPATYYASIETLPGCISMSDVAKVTIHDKPGQPSISANGHILTSGGFSLYQWYLNGSAVAGATNSVHNATVNGSYHVIGFDTNGCFGISDTVEVTTVGIDLNASNKTFSVFPNPSSDIINVRLVGQGEANWQIKVLSMEGQLILERNIHGSNQGVIELSGLSKGSYFMLVRSGNETAHEIIVVN